MYKHRLTQLRYGRACVGAAGGPSLAKHRTWKMTMESERAFHLERAEQCRKMAAEAPDPAVRSLHEQLAQFHEAEAWRQLPEVAANEVKV